MRSHSVVQDQTRFKPSIGITILLWVTAAGIVAYWVSYFTDGSVYATEDVCCHVFQRDFPAPDGMIALMCIATAVGLRGAKEWSLFTGMTAVGGLLFLALIDISFNLWNHLYFDASGAMGTEVFINIVCLASAAIIWSYFV